MVELVVQTPVNKNSEFVDRATQIIDLIYAHLDKEPNCQHCLELLNKTVQREPTSQEPETIPEPTENNHVQ